MQGCPERPDAPTEFSLVAGCPVRLGQRASLQRLTPVCDGIDPIVRRAHSRAGTQVGAWAPALAGVQFDRPCKPSPAEPAPHRAGSSGAGYGDRVKTAFSEWIASAAVADVA